MCGVESIEPLGLQPLQLCRPITRMKTTTGTSMDFSFIKLHAQTLCHLRAARVSPREQRRGRAAGGVDSNQAVPKTRDRNELDPAIGDKRRCQ